MIDPIETGVNLGKKPLEFTDTVIEKIENYQKISQDITAYLCLLYLEIDNKLEVFKTINFDSFVNTKVNDPRVKTILKLHQPGMSESIFSNWQTIQIPVVRQIEKKGKVDNRGQELVKISPKGIEVKAYKSFLYENILQAISFVL